MQKHAYYWLSNNFRSENIPISCKHIFEKASQGWFKIIDLPERKCLFMVITRLFWAMERMNHSDIHYKFCNKWDYCWFFFYIHHWKGKLGLYLPRLYCNVRSPLWMIMVCLTEYNFLKYLWMSMCCLCNGKINMLFLNLWISGGGGEWFNKHKTACWLCHIIKMWLNFRYQIIIPLVRAESTALKNTVYLSTTSL